MTPPLRPLIVCAVAAWLTSPVLAEDPPKTPMTPYTQSIPGTNLKFDMVPIPGGTFEMGSPESEPGHTDDESPVHSVTVGPFWMGKYEITWNEFEEYAYSLDVKKKSRTGVDLTKQSDSEKAADAVTRPTPPYTDMTFGLGRNNNPAICMTHHSALEYCRWLSAKTGKEYRLPTEAEWEYACRAGTKTPYSFGDDPSKLGDYAWYVDNAEKPMPIGKKKPNPWGLYDMHGNVAEWCIDHYVPNYEAFANGADRPVVLPDAKEYAYVVRGGTWDDDADRLRSAARRASEKDWSVQDPQRPQSIWWHTDARFIGLRVVRPLEEQPNLKGFKSPVVKGKGTK